jgi:hypothetical protein
MELRYLTAFKKKTPPPPPLPVPKAPAAPTKGAVTDTSIVVSFVKQTGDTVDSFDLQYRKQGDTAWIPKNTVPSPQTISGLTAETTYEFQVRATNKSGSSAWSASLTAATTTAS